MLRLSLCYLFASQTCTVESDCAMRTAGSVIAVDGLWPNRSCTVLNQNDELTRLSFLSLSVAAPGAVDVGATRAPTPRQPQHSGGAAFERADPQPQPTRRCFASRSHTASAVFRNAAEDGRSGTKHTKGTARVFAYMDDVSSTLCCPRNSRTLDSP